MNLIIKTTIAMCLSVMAAHVYSTEKTDSVTIPWIQFKELYREHLKKELLKQSKPEKKRIIPTELTGSICKVIFSKKSCRASYEIKGRRGNVADALLLRGKYAVTEPVTTGCARLQRMKHGIGISLSKDGTPEFTVKFSISLPVKAQNGNYRAALEIPECLTNKIDISLKDKLYLNMESWAGLKDKDNSFAATPGKHIITATDPGYRKIQLGPDLDLYTNYRFRANRMQLQIKALVNPGSGRAFNLQLPAGARCSRGSLPRYAQLDTSGKIRFTLPANINNISLDCELEMSSKRLAKLKQPYISGNRGREGFFNVEQPQGAEVKVAAQNLQKDVFNFENNTKSFGCWSAPVNNPLSFTVRQLTKVSQPEVIVNTINFCSAIEENGSVISVLSFNYPGSGKLKLKKITNGKLWRFTVNGKKSGIYEDGDFWRIDLPPGRDSNKVEMAFLLTGKKPGIQGIYRSAMPDCGLNARRVLYTAVLPKRLELRGFEGGIDPLPKDISPPRLPDNISGNRYNFYRPYYRGGTIEAEFFYREPPKKQ